MASLKSQEKENRKKALKKFKEKGYDMQLDAFGPGSKVESKTKLPDFFKYIPDAFQTEKFLQEKVKPKLMKKKKSGGIIDVNRGDGAAIRGKTKGRIL